jgi:hypothetical protein
MIQKIFISLGILVFSLPAFSQKASETFNSTRIINGHSIETLKKRFLEYRIEHRFGDIGGTAGGADQGFGFDAASDIRFAFEYGISDKLMIGVARCKGSTNAYRSILDGFVKYKILEQEEGKMPLSMTVVGASLYSYMKAGVDISRVDYFPTLASRLAYSTQLNIARKMNQRLSLSLMPTYVYRNYVSNNDVNGLFAIGGAISFKLTKTWAILTEYYHTLNPSKLTNHQNSFSIGAEWCTNGHNFHFNLTNASLFNEAQFIAATTQKWDLGQFRLGFSISRNFKR